MRYVPIDQAQVGMVLGNPIFDLSGRILIGAGVELSQQYIEHLREYGFSGVYVDDELSRGIEVASIISPKLRQSGMECLKRGDLDSCKKICESLVDEILSKEYISLDMMDLRSYEDHTYAHSINVAVLCTIIGMGMNLGKKELENLTLAALLHDIGKQTIPLELLNKKGRLTEKEFAIIKNHPVASYDMIKERWDISAEVKAAVLFHHENVDGSGYPRGIEAKDMTINTKILHVADVYDALTAKRPYKNPYSPLEATEYLMGGCGIMFDLKCVDTLLKYVPIYPKGTTVRLSDGREGIVYENSGVNNLRPILRLMNGSMLDLTSKDCLNLTIVPDKNAVVAVPDQDEFAQDPTMRRRYHIYVVDDMEVNLTMLEDILKDVYQVSLFRSGGEVIDQLKKDSVYPSLILMDIDMPQMTGIETVKAVHEEISDQIPILFVSSLCDPGTVMSCKQLNVDGYVVRPYNDIYILSEIKRILERLAE